MAQAVGRRPLTAETWGQLQASPLVICGGKSCTGHFIYTGDQQSDEVPLRLL